MAEIKLLVDIPARFARLPLFTRHLRFGSGLLRLWSQIYANGRSLTSVASSAKSSLWRKCLQGWINSYVVFIQPSEFKQCRLKIYWRCNILHHKPDNLNNKKPIKYCIKI